MILEEFDFDKEAIISPLDFVKPIDGMPKTAVTCFEHQTFERLVRLLNGQEIGQTGNANTQFPIYKANYKGTEIALYMSDMTAAGAGGHLEEMFAVGVEKVIVFGSCGVLDQTIEDCSIIIPKAAVRDEGMSYHYAPPSDEIAVNPKYMQEFEELLEQEGCSYRTGKVWTTDAFYRETKAKMEKRKAQGCICVDMECSAMAAIAQFRGKELFQFFITADCLDGEQWDRRSLNGEVKFTEKDYFARMALEMAVKIA